MKLLAPHRSERAGFTLAEVAVTIVIVGIVLTLAAQGLNNSMFQATHSRNLKVARQLGLLTLGQVESGLMIDDLEEHMEGTYADEEYPAFSWELVFGEEAFYEEDELEGDRFNSWDEEEEEEEELTEEPWEVVRVKVRFPGPEGIKSEVILEKWITWDFVYGVEEEQPR